MAKTGKTEEMQVDDSIVGHAHSSVMISSEIVANIPELTETIGDFLLSERRFFNFSMKSILWVYNSDNGIWEPNGEEVVIQSSSRILKTNKVKPRARLLSEIISYIRSQSIKIGATLGGPVNKIVLKNGVLNIETAEFSVDFAPDEYHITAIPVTYDPDCDCDAFKQFLVDVIPDLDDRDAVVQFFGYCLLKRYIYEIIMLLVGEGANGKSILLSVLREFLGTENITSVTPQQLEQSRFAAAQLHGKLANIAGDIPAYPLKYTGTMKMLTGGDAIHAEHKNRDPFDFVNFAKLIFSANQVPESKDASQAFYRRMKIIEFPNQFTPSNPKFVPRDILIDKLTNSMELSGILNMALAGLKELRGKGSLSGEMTIAEKKMDYIKRSDPAHYFFEQYLFQDPTAVPIEKSLFYDIYVKFCHSIGKVPISDGWFGKKLKQLVPYAEESRPREGDKRKTVWKGFGMDYVKYDKEVGRITLSEDYEPLDEGPLTESLKDDDKFDDDVYDLKQ